MREYIPYMMLHDGNITLLGTTFLTVFYHLVGDIVMADFKAKEILLNAFDMNCVGHINHGLWTHPRDESHRFNELSYWTEQVKL